MCGIRRGSLGLMGRRSEGIDWLLEAETRVVGGASGKLEVLWGGGDDGKAWGLGFREEGEEKEVVAGVGEGDQSGRQDEE